MKTPKDIIFASLFTITVPAIGYISFGVVPALLFLIGYFGGLVCWLIVPSTETFKSIKWIYWLTFLLFFVHRVEEKVSGFFDELARMTGVPIPEIVSAPIILLVLISVGAWIIGPWLASKGSAFGSYLVWTFFASMGITELAHFILPFFRDEAYGYFPGMLSVVALAPVAWYGIYKFSNYNKKPI